MPTIVENDIAESGGDYTTIAAWESDTDNDLVSADEIQRGILFERASTDWDETVTIAGATVDATRYRELTVDPAGQHDGTEGSGTIIDPTGSAHVFTISENEFHLDHIAIRDWVGNSSEAFRVNNTNLHLSHLMIYDSNTSSQDGIYLGNNSLDVFVHNCFFFSINRGGVFLQAVQDCNVYLSNSSGFNLNISANSTAGGFCFDLGGGRNNNGSTIWCKNVSSDAGNDAFHGGGQGGNEGTVDATTCACSDNSLTTGDTVITDGNELENVVQADQFVDLTATTVDLHLKAGNDLEEVGTDLSADANLPFSDDIDGTTRTDPWDIGGHEFSAAAAGGSQAWPSPTKQMAHLILR